MIYFSNCKSQYMRNIKSYRCWKFSLKELIFLEQFDIPSSPYFSVYLKKNCYIITIQPSRSEKLILVNYYTVTVQYSTVRPHSNLTDCSDNVHYSKTVQFKISCCSGQCSVLCQYHTVFCFSFL